MDQLDAGRAPEAFSFNLLRNFLPEKPDYYSLVGFFAVPQGEDEFTPARRAALETYILGRAEQMLPGLGAALLYQRLVSPADFRRFHGLSSTAVPRIPKAGFPRPDNLDPRTGVYHVGISVYPPGNEGNAAVQSGAHVADLVMQRLAPTLVQAA
jgi:phytoene dehydrogenase-like protein